MGINDIMKAKHIILLAFGKRKNNLPLKNLIDSDIIDESIPCTVLKKTSKCLCISR